MRRLQGLLACEQVDGEIESRIRKLFLLPEKPLAFTVDSESL